jgi:hypothetical protein
MVASSSKAKKAGAADTVTLSQLNDICKENVAKYESTDNTRKAYEGSINRGRDFIKALVARRKKVKVKDGIPNKQLGAAFNDIPNQYSAYALQIFIAQKCFTEECSKSTADIIYSAWVRLWTKAYVAATIIDILSLKFTIAVTLAIIT